MAWIDATSEGNLSAPPLGRVRAASCFPAQAGREEPCSQLWVVPFRERDGDEGVLAQTSEERLGSQRLLLLPLLLGLWDNSRSWSGGSRKLVWLMASDLTTDTVCSL